MASDQMLPNSSISSKKQQQLEAGKKRLEEFRKKKAAAKKAASTNSAQSTNGDLHELKPSVSDTVQVTDISSDSGSGLHVGKNNKKTIDVHDTNSISTSNKPSTDGKLGHDASNGVDIENSIALYHPEVDDDDDDIIHSKINNFSITRVEDALKNSRDDRLKDLTYASPVTTRVSITKSSSERSHGANKLSHIDQPANGSTYADSSSEIGKSVRDMLDNRYPPVSAVDDYKNYYNNKNLFDHQASESSSFLRSSTSFASEAVPSHNQTSMSSAAAAAAGEGGLAGRRSRPSFLDSITVSRNSSSSLSNAAAETDKANPNPFRSKVHPVDAPPVANNNNNNNVGHHQGGINEVVDMERRNDFNSTKQNEDFAALEQHIEDLTQEKFSLQRALEASRVLAESLATENSALTDTYNQQGGIVNQLKSDMERLQEEIKAQLVELEAVRTEYGNAQLECSAADERAKLLASEVIGLEEKALRLRSNELKLERQLENMEAEMSSQKRRISSLEKERQDLQSTIDALQEEKKLMQSKLRKAPAIGNSVDIKKSPTTARKEASTSTHDLENESEDSTTTATSNLAAAVVSESVVSMHSLSRTFGLEFSSTSIPPDQMRMIQNINTLISELALEKEELMQAFSTESSLSSKLKSLNKELSQKLEVQTQRLELLTSQSMVSSDNIPPPRKSAPRSTTTSVVDNTPYADEGDEVVERVLGWIMKLFPGGGPSRRQTKHHL